MKCTKKKQPHRESSWKCVSGTQWTGSSVDIHYTRNPHKPNLCVEIRLGSAGESAVHTAVAKPITSCRSSPMLLLNGCSQTSTSNCEDKKLKEERKGYLFVPNVRVKDKMSLPNYLQPEMKDWWKNRQDLMQLAWRKHTLVPPPRNWIIQGFGWEIQMQAIR